MARLALALALQVHDRHVHDGPQVGERLQHLHEVGGLGGHRRRGVQAHELRVTGARANKHDAVVQVRQRGRRRRAAQRLQAQAHHGRAVVREYLRRRVGWV